MDVDNFWSTGVNSRPISAHEGSIRVSGTVLVHFDGHRQYVVSKNSPTRTFRDKDTAREHSFLSHHRGPQRQQ